MIRLFAVRVDWWLLHFYCWWVFSFIWYISYLKEYIRSWLPFGSPTRTWCEEEERRWFAISNDDHEHRHQRKYRISLLRWSRLSHKIYSQPNKNLTYNTTNHNLNQNLNMMFQNTCLAILAVIPMLMTVDAAVSQELFSERNETPRPLLFLHSFLRSLFLALPILVWTYIQFRWQWFH